MSTQDAKLLLQRYLAGECTEDEKLLLEAWWTELQAEFEWEIPAGQEQAVHGRMLSRIKAELGGELAEATAERSTAPVRQLPWRRYAAAAVVMLLAAGGWLWRSQHRVPSIDESPITIEAPPGGDKAVLTLGNGKQVILDSAANGMLVIQGNRQVIKQNGELSYEQHEKGARTEVMMNTLAIPRGGNYKLVLADGTRVWLDASSSITYPTAFVGKTRQVSISGQAYFEVMHNASMPFEVKVQGQTIRDIGTAFNINAYPDEPTMKITLANGAVTVGPASDTGTPDGTGSAGGASSASRTGATILLDKPGLQAEYKDSRPEPVHVADLTAVLAWKNGLFYLTSADIPTVMRQVGRWYDVDIQFDKGIPAGHITGEVPRNTNLSIALQVLRTSGVHFTTEGKTIHVMP